MYNLDHVTEIHNEAETEYTDVVEKHKKGDVLQGQKPHISLMHLPLFTRLGYVYFSLSSLPFFPIKMSESIAG